MCNVLKSSLIRLSFVLILGVFNGVYAVEAEKSLAEGEMLNDYELLALAKSILKTDAEDNKQRESLFKLELDKQLELLKKSENRLEAAEKKQAELKEKFDENEARLGELELKLDQRAGALGEVFGVAKQSAMEFVPMLEDSLTSADHPRRASLLAFSESKRVPTISDFKALLNELIVEMQAGGQVASFNAPVVDDQGKLTNREVVRFGTFSTITSDGEYLEWDVAEQVLKELTTQPDSSSVSVADLTEKEYVTVLLDPSRGELFALLDRMPNLVERIKQGGTVGYLIISLGVLGLLVAVVQIIRLVMTEILVRKQLKDKDVIKLNNPLGRVLSAVKGQGSTESSETFEMRIDKSILKELPKIEQGQSFLKLLAAVAPLLGLLGTVVGMIATFQSITLFGTSDPKLMANGISQALMTTVLGLVVAVPILFFHSLLVSRGRRLVQILQEKSLALIIQAPNSDLGCRESGSKVGEELHVA